MFPVLSKYFTVVTYDLRGYGESPIPDGEFGLDELVNDLERAREKTGIERNPRQGQSGFITTVLCFTLSAGDRRTEDGGSSAVTFWCAGKGVGWPKEGLRGDLRSTYPMSNEIAYIIVLSKALLYIVKRLEVLPCLNLR